MDNFILTALVTISMIAVGFIVWRLLERQEERAASRSKKEHNAPQDIDVDKDKS